MRGSPAIARRRRRTCRLAPSSGGGLEVLVENQPSKHECKSPKELKHFAAFYQLLEEEPKTEHIPTCRGIICPVCKDEDEVVYCPPTEYDHP